MTDTNTYLTPDAFHALTQDRPRKPGVGLFTETVYASKLEARYAEYLESLKRGQAIWDYWYEPLNLRLGVHTYYKPDFLVQLPNGFLEVHECKGHWTDDGRVKWKVAATLHPYFQFVAVQWVNGQWQEERL